MHFLHVLLSVFAFQTVTTSAAIVPERAHLKARDNVAAAEAILIALQASPFCSSFVPIKDVTSTKTITGTTAITQVTVTAPCTNALKRRQQITARAPAIMPRAPTTTPSRTTTAAATSCTIPGVPLAVLSFPCDVIKQACLLFVKPKTTTATTFTQPTSTSTTTLTPTCPRTTRAIPTTTSSTAAMARCTPPLGVTENCSDGTTCTTPVKCYANSNSEDCTAMCQNSYGTCYSADYDPSTAICNIYTNCCS